MYMNDGNTREKVIMKEFKDLKIAVAGTGYVGLSLAVLLAQHHQVTALDIVPEKVEMINNKKSPIRDEYIEKYLAEKELDLTATLDAKEAYAEQRQATAEEQEVLSRYVGWGGIPQAFDEKNADWAKEYAELKSLLPADEYSEARAL